MTKEEKIVGQCKSSVSKELMENLLIEFDEMGFEPTTLCDSQREIDSFRNRLKQVLDYLKSIDNSNPSEASIDTATEMLLTGLEMLSDCAVAIEEEPSSNWIEYAETEAELDLKLHFAYLDIKQALLKAQEQEKVLSIIKEKNVNIGLVKVLGNVEQYNQTYVYDNMRNVKWCLIQEEFDLLKRYLGNE